MTSHSLSFTSERLRCNNQMRSSKSLRACLLQFKNDLRQRLVKQRFFKSVSLITGFEKTVLGCHSNGSSFGEQALAG